MSNFLRFEKDIDIVKTILDMSLELKFHAFGGTSWFNISGHAYPNSNTNEPTIFEIENAFILPAGQYSISINKELKSFFSMIDRLYFKIGEIYEEVEKEPKILTVEKQNPVSLVFYFESGQQYLIGDNYKKQENYGKDYSIQINLVSGGIYERERKYAVLKGDTTEDGTITFEDLAKMRAYMLGAEFLNENDLFRYDLNRDGVVDSIDFLLLRKYLICQEKLYEVEFRERLPYTES